MISIRTAQIIIRSGSFYGPGSGLIFELVCSEGSKNTTDCTYETVNNCTHANEAGVVCTGMYLTKIYVSVSMT